jgi:hypothetical protein
MLAKVDIIASQYSFSNVSDKTLFAAWKKEIKSLRIQTVGTGRILRRNLFDLATQ